MILQFIGAVAYNVEVETSSIFHEANAGIARMIRLKRHDTGPKIRAVVKDNWGRTVNLLNAEIKFIMKSFNQVEGPDSEVVVVSDSGDIQIHNQLSSRGEGYFERSFTEEETAVAGRYKAEFQIKLRATLKSRKTGPFEIEAGETLQVKVDGEDAQIITFTATTSQSDIVDQINAQLDGAQAYAFDCGYVVIQSDDKEGSVQVTGGEVADKLGFPVDIASAEKITVPTDKFYVYIIEDLDQVENKSEDE